MSDTVNNMLYGHSVPTGPFELPKLTPVFYFDINLFSYLDIWTAYTDDWFQPVEVLTWKTYITLQQGRRVFA